MSLELQTTKQVASALFVKIVCNHYKLAPEDTPQSVNLTFSEWHDNIVIDGEEYLPLGELMAVSASNSELRASSGQTDITITGVPADNIAEVLHSKMKGSRVYIYRMFFDPITNQPLTMDRNPVGRFNGIINNVILAENFGVDNTIIFECSNEVGIMEKKITGRKTNPRDMKRLYPSDTSFDRVPNLSKANFNFGGPRRSYDIY